MRFLVLLLVLVGSVAHADLRPYTAKTFTVQLVCGGGVDCVRAVQVFELTQQFHSSLDVHLNLQGVHEIKEEMSGEAPLVLIKWAIRTAKLPPSDVTIIALPNFSSLADTFNYDAESTMGMASGIGVLGKKSCGIFSRIAGSNKLASKIMIHEMGHLLGATHTNKGLMYPSTEVGQYSEALADENIRQIEKHLASLP